MHQSLIRTAKLLTKQIFILSDLAGFGFMLYFDLNLKSFSLKERF